MLSANNRLRSSAIISSTIRRGRKSGNSLVVMYLDRGVRSDAPPEVAFAVSKSVGNSVVRHRVARQLRHGMRSKINRLSPGTRVVIRALPGCATASWDGMNAALDNALGKLVAASSVAS